MKRVAILGSTGMLGSMGYRVLKNSFELIVVCRSLRKLAILEKNYGKIRDHQKIFFDFESLLPFYLKGLGSKNLPLILEELVNKIGNVDGVINCLGLTNRYANDHPLLAYFLNSSLPHLLSRIYGSKLIHISTDCVYDGLDGAPYDEFSTHTPTDLYGLTKSLGEPKTDSLVFRTSIIGPEIANHNLLLDWFRRQEKGATVRGFTDHLWNGITSKQFILICQQVIEQRNRFPEKGLFHLYSTDISKYNMLLAFRDRFKSDVKIVPYRSSPIDRRLRSQYNLCKALHIPSFINMLKDIDS